MNRDYEVESLRWRQYLMFSDMHHNGEHPNRIIIEKINVPIGSIETRYESNH